MLKKTTLVSSSSSTSGGTSTNTGTSEPTIFYTQNNSGDLVSLGGAGSATFLTLEGLGGEGGEVTEAVVMQDGTICTAEGNHIAVDSK